MLLFHGMDGRPEGMVPLARRLASEFPEGAVVSIRSPHSSGSSGGYQWFPVDGVTEENRPARIAGAMPVFLAEIGEWQRALDVTPAVTALVGFSQGAIMSLESIVTASPPAARVVAIGARFARLPDRAPANTTVHLLHGKEDAVIPYRLTIDAAHRLRDLGGDVTADVLPFVGHEINDEIADLAVERLRGYVPKRLWDEALRSAARLPGAGT